MCPCYSKWWVIEIFNLNPVAFQPWWGCNMQHRDYGITAVQPVKLNKKTQKLEFSLNGLFFQSLWASMAAACDRGRVALHLTAAGVNLNNKCHWTTDGGGHFQTRGPLEFLLQLSEFILCCPLSSCAHWNNKMHPCITWPRHFFPINVQNK